MDGGAAALEEEEGDDEAEETGEDATSVPPLADVTPVRLESVSRLNRFKSARISLADW
jgi:hypothetical protein